MGMELLRSILVWSVVDMGLEQSRLGLGSILELELELGLGRSVLVVGLELGLGSRLGRPCLGLGRSRMGLGCPRMGMVASRK